MQNRPVIIGIFGPGEHARQEDCDMAYKIGKIIASENYIVLTGGRNYGVMDAALKGAKESGGTTIGILPGNNTTDMSHYVDIPIITGLGNARNVINILTSSVIIVIGEGPGTLSEIALALKAERPVVALNTSSEAAILFKRNAKKSFIVQNRFEKNEFIALLKKIINET